MPNKIELDPSLAEDFVTEAEEYLDNIDQKLLDLESQLADRDCVDDIFRAIHTIKGLAGFLELELISELSHKLETLLDEIRKQKREATQEVIDLLFQGIDLIRKLISDVEQTLSKGETVYSASTQLANETGLLLDDLGRILDGSKPMAGEKKDKNKNLTHSEDAPAPQKKEADVSSKPSKKKTKRKTKTKPPESNAGSELNAGSNKKTDQQSASSESEKPSFEIPKKLYDDFQIEAEEHLDICDQSLITLDKHRDNHEAINNLFRSIHTIKGSASYLGLKSISTFTHALEELLDIIRAQDSFHLADELMDIFFESIDCLKGMIQTPNDPDILRRSHDLLNKILAEKEKLQEDNASKLLHVQETPKKNSPEHIFMESARQFVESYKNCINKLKEENPPNTNTLEVLERVISSLISSATYMGYDRLQKIAELSQETLQSLKAGEIASPLAAVQFLEDNLKEITSFLNEIERGASNKSSSEPVDSKASEESTSETTDQAESASQVSDETTPTSETAISSPRKESLVEGNRAKAADNTKSTASNTKTMRIDQRLLDVFMNLVGELIVT
ncbi:MAG: Hpt domain-containing protein, partial [candidate division KSB1 bacterium]|nr:Hpt domain-containing protein [candidate division KSB1 bacterium]